MRNVPIPTEEEVDFQLGVITQLFESFQLVLQKKKSQNWPIYLIGVHSIWKYFA